MLRVPLFSRPAFFIGTLLLFVFAAVPRLFAEESPGPAVYIATVGSQSALVRADGTFEVRNLPAFMAWNGTDPGPLLPYRLRIESSNGEFGATETFLLSTGELSGSRPLIVPPPIQFGDRAFGEIPNRLRIVSPTAVLTYGIQVQLRLLKISDGVETDISGSTDTQWLSSNNRLAMVGTDGRVLSTVRTTTPVQIFVSALNQGMLATLPFTIPANLSPNELDTDGDGIPNDWEVLYRFNPNDPDDADRDADNDGLTNRREFQIGTNPLLPDTDRDGLSDGIDDNPLVPETQPPVVSILSPIAGATFPGGDTVVLSATATDNAVIARIQVSFNGIIVTSVFNQTAVTLPISLPNEPGNEVIAVTATDLAGNVSLAQVSIIVQAGSGNLPPVVNAGIDRALPVGILSTILFATVTDDGLPVPPQITSTWTVDAGAPGNISFTAPNALTTSVTVSTPGTYRFRLNAFDGESIGTDDMVVQFSSGTPAPTDRLHLLDVSADTTPNGTFRRVLETTVDGRFTLALTTATLVASDTESTENLVLWDRWQGAVRLLPSLDEVIAAAMSDDGKSAVILAKDSGGTFRIDDLDVVSIGDRHSISSDSALFVHQRRWVTNIKRREKSTEVDCPACSRPVDRPMNGICERLRSGGRLPSYPS